MAPTTDRDAPRMPEKCPRCFAERLEPWQFCPSCGLPLDPAHSAEPVDSTNISYVRRPAAAPAPRRLTLSEGLLQSGLHLLVLMAFFGLVAGGIVILSPDFLETLTSPPPAASVDTPVPSAPPMLALESAGADEIEFVTIPAGLTLVGDPRTWPDRALEILAKPEWTDEDREVVRPYLGPEIERAFEISKYEITNDQYYRFLIDRYEAAGIGWMREGPARDWTETDEDEFPPPRWDQEDDPVRSITFLEAQEYAAWLGRKTGRVVRLPKWYEWEKAARGPEGWRYPWGDEWDPRRCNSDAQPFKRPVSVALFGPTVPADRQDVSFYGVYDLAGNVSEWVESHEDAGAKYVMGGGYDGDSYWAQCWVKSEQLPTFRARYLGFRVVREIEE